MAYDTADDAIAKVEEDVRRAQERLERLPLLRAAVEAVRGSAVNQQRDMAVTVDNTGEAVSIRIEDKALDRGATRLSTDLIRLLKQARQDVQERMTIAAAEVLGEDDPVVSSYRAMSAAGASRQPETPHTMGDFR
jgi:hypothetical protein